MIDESTGEVWQDVGDLQRGERGGAGYRMTLRISRNKRFWFSTFFYQRYENFLMGEGMK